MNSRQLYFRLLQHALPYRGMFALALLGTAVFAATEPLMAALLKPLLDETFVARNTGNLLLLPLLLVLVFLVRGLAGFTSTVGMQWVATRVVMDLRTQMFRRADLPAMNNLQHALEQRMEAVMKCFQEMPAAGFCGGGHGLRLCGVQGKRLFTQHVLAGLERGDGPACVFAGR